ncbi:MAG: Trk system potassium transporter TrkA [Oscillospiraceae bacterium]|nr:Trk system potassium transporter TrkA [Oscillospiraceae bacterium]
MHIIIAGDGMVGSTLTRLLCAENHDVTLIDCDNRVLEDSLGTYDVMAVQGNCASMEVLLQAGIKDADLLIAVTSADEVNLLCCTIAHGLNHELHTIARIRNPEYTEQAFKLRDIFGLSLVINPDLQAATEIEHLIKFPGFLKRDSFANGRTEIVELRVDSASKLRDVALLDMYNIVKCKVLVCAVIRDGAAITPRGDFVLREGDRIFVTAPTENLATLLKNLGIVTRRVRRAILCGGGRIAYYLADLLDKHGVAVQLIEQDDKLCQSLASQLPGITVIHGDAADQDLLASEGIREADALVSLTGLDELNMIVSLYAQSCGVPQVITKLRRADNRTLIDALKLGSVISPKELCSNTIARYVRAMGNQVGAAVSVHSIADGQVEAIEFLVDSSTEHCNTPLKDIKLKPGVLLVSITHGSKTEIPNGMSTFRRYDTIVVVTSGRGKLSQLNDIFA